MYSDKLEIGQLDIGVSKQGMKAFKEALQLKLLTQVKDKINETSDVIDAINDGWQGASRDKFITDFANAIEALINDIAAEYTDLENRLTELESAYYDIDNKLMEL